MQLHGPPTSWRPSTKSSRRARSCCPAPSRELWQRAPATFFTLTTVRSAQSPAASSESVEMDVPSNRFKRALREGKPQIGLWLALADPVAAELCASAGFDWLLLDAEHGPNDLRTILAQLQAIAPYAGHPVVRVRVGDTHIIKQVLELGAQSMLIPMVETAEQAAAMVAAMQYPPAGVRGVGAVLGRSSRWNRIPQYLNQAGNEMCLLVQIETLRGVENVKAIAATPGVDGVFIGPADLSASMGH